MAEGGEDRNYGDPVLPSSLLAWESKSASLAVGENVNQRIINSSVNVVAGDQITVNKITNNYTMNSGIEAITTDQQKAATLIKRINDNASQKTADRILEDIGADDLSKPDFQVHPQMRRVTKSEYFKGNYEEVHGMEVEVKKKFFFWQKKEVVKNQFRKEFGFLRQEVDDNKFIELDEVLQQVIYGKSSITAIVASAGSGKTTLMRRIARKTLGHSLTNTDAIVSPFKLKYKLISYIEIKGMQDEGSMKPSKFLFGGLFQDEIDEEHAFQWLLEHQSEAVLFFDGLDQATWQINRDGDKNINPYTPAEAATIMYNILSHNILGDTKIVFSSREFQVSDLPAEARPADIITLSGLTLDDAKKLFVFLIHQHGDEAWEKIETMSPRLINLVSIPVFLVLTAVIMAKNPNEPPPKTVTGLYKKIISTLSSVKNIRKADAIAEVINKLKAMAYRGMKEGRVTFSENDLKKFGLSKDEVQDLMMKVPGNNLLSCNLLDGSFIFFFCHQSLQEFLAAGFVVEMTRTKFTSFNSKHLHKERWSVVRRFVCGLMYDETPDNLHEVSNRSLKKRFLTRSIRSHLKEDDERVHMELYTAIYESGDDDLMKQISDLDVSDISLSRDEAHIVGSLAARSESLMHLGLHNCNINDELLAIITGCLGQRIHVKEVNLRYNKFSATALRSLLGHRRIESLSGKLDWEVVQLTVDGSWIQLKNKEDVIAISGPMFGGRFTIKDSNLSFNRVRAVADVVFLGILFDAEFIKFKEQIQLMAKQDDLQKLSEFKLNKISKILLDCTKEEENIDWSLIETCWKKYQLHLLDIAVNGLIPVQEYSRILKRGTAISVPVHVHAMFYVARADEFRRASEACQEKKIEYIRYTSRYPASLDEISSLVNNSNLKKVTLIYRDESDMPKGAELQKVQKIANDLDTELEVLKLFRETDAWKRLDLDFYYRSIENKLTQSTGKPRLLTTKESLLSPKSTAEKERDQYPYQEVLEIIGGEGKTIEIGGCSVTFPPDCTVQRVRVSAELNPKRWPPGKIGITPSININAGRLQKPVQIKLETWRILDREDYDNMVDVFHFNESLKDWEVVHGSKLGTSRTIEFQAQDLSPFVAALKELLFGPQTSIVLPVIYYYEEKFFFIVMLDNILAKDHCTAKFKRKFHDGDIGIEEFSSLRCTRRTSVQTKIFCHTPNNGLVFSPSGFFPHRIADFFDGGISTSESRLLLKEWRNKERVNIGVDIRKDGNSQPHTITCDWKSGSVREATSNLQPANHDNQRTGNPINVTSNLQPANHDNQRTGNPINVGNNSTVNINSQNTIGTSNSGIMTSSNKNCTTAINSGTRGTPN